MLPALYAAGLICRKWPSRAEFRAAWQSHAFRLQAMLLPVVGVATGLWYQRNFHHVLQHVRDASYGPVALGYGHRAPWPSKFAEWSRLSFDSFLAPCLGWVFLAVLVGAGFWGMRRFRQRCETARIEPVAVIAALQIPLVLSVFSTTIIIEPRFLYALLPSIAIVFVQLCAFLPARLLVAAVVACGAQWAAVNAESLAITGRFTHRFEWSTTPEFDGSHYDDLTRVVGLTSDANGRTNIVGVESVWMNANSAAFFAAKNRLRTGVRSDYFSLGYAESDFGRAMRRIQTLRARYVITLAEPFQTGLPAIFNVVSLPVLGQMRTDADRFRQVPYASPNGVLAFRVRDVPPTGDAAGKTP